MSTTLRERDEMSPDAALGARVPNVATGVEQGAGTNESGSQTRVVYLIGAGATHACAQRVRSPHSLLMRGLGPPLSRKVRQLAVNDYSAHPSLNDLVNTVIDEETDFEHVISFLDESPSRLHRQFADDLRQAFEEVLRDQLKAVSDDGDGNPIELYQVLFDIYNIPNCPEALQGILTTNYDPYIEEALDTVGLGPVDFGFILEDPPASGTRLLKLHGSFDWQDTWPISRGSGDATLWIPPGINKEKQTYPFNILWGLARELLSCDVLRVIGCRLDANDWDLVSLLFTSMHVHSPYQPYRIEVIDSPLQAKYLKQLFPYLYVQSILEIDEIGRQLVSEWGGGRPRPFVELTEAEQEAVLVSAGTSRNWFEEWLRQKAEQLSTDQESLDTPTGALERFLEQ